ncbi:MAG: phosphoadenylyl-sulfate reductase [Alphaproteobacteria bacterium]|nr:phosphoadenylyl-sulfate reductase [Alphaproteobacteria bacterium]
MDALERIEWAQRRVAALRETCHDLDGTALLRVTIRREFPGRIAVTSSFGAEAALLLALVAEVEPATPVLFLDTGKLFAETHAYREALVERLGLTTVRVVHPDPDRLAALDPAGTLHRANPDACCGVRKVAPLAGVLGAYDAWITGRKRYQGGERAALATVESAAGRVKVNPLAAWSSERVARESRERGLPEHPLVAQGYRSIGCAPCSRAVRPDEDPRAGRWSGTDKTECGIHTARWSDIS